MTTPTITSLIPGKKVVVQWSGASTSGNSAVKAYDTLFSLAIASVQVTGTFGSATVTLLGSNDGTNFVAIKDAGNSAMSFTAAGIAELSSGFRYYKPNIAGGTSDSLTITICHCTE